MQAWVSALFTKFIRVPVVHAIPTILPPCTYHSLIPEIADLQMFNVDNLEVAALLGRYKVPVAGPPVTAELHPAGVPEGDAGSK